MHVGLNGEQRGRGKGEKVSSILFYFHSNVTSVFFFFFFQIFKKEPFFHGHDNYDQVGPNLSCLLGSAVSH